MAKEANENPSKWEVYMESRNATLAELDRVYGTEGAAERMNKILRALDGMSIADFAVALSSAMLAATSAEVCMAVGPDGNIVDGANLARNRQHMEICETLMYLAVVSEGYARIQDIEGENVPDSVRNRRSIIKEVNSIEGR